jgi:rhamnopyranosyl-N-acetylglucosaminyl-diphospho-decaprenol beta-1,3/1,4-galactofuranosyltransferase
LRKLAEQTRSLDHLLVIDNHPLEANREAFADYERAGHDATYLPQPDNLGPAGGYAAGMSRALDDLRGTDDAWVVLVDDDDPPRGPTLLDRMTRFAEEMIHRDPSTGAVGAAGARFDVRRGRVDRPRDAELTGPVPIHWIGNNILPLYAVDALRKVGPMDPRLFFGFEELDLGLRLGRDGFHLYANGSLMLEGRRVSGGLGGTPGPSWRNLGVVWRRYYTIRNLIWTLRRNGAAMAAARVTLSVGILKPLLGLLIGPTDRFAFAAASFRGCFDGWTGRMGRRVEPVGGDPSGGPVGALGSVRTTAVHEQGSA